MCHINGQTFIYWWKRQPSVNCDVNPYYYRLSRNTDLDPTCLFYLVKIVRIIRPSFRARCCWSVFPVAVFWFVTRYTFLAIDKIRASAPETPKNVAHTKNWMPSNQLQRYMFPRTTPTYISMQIDRVSKTMFRKNALTNAGCFICKRNLCLQALAHSAKVLKSPNFLSLLSHSTLLFKSSKSEKVPPWHTNHATNQAFKRVHYLNYTRFRDIKHM